MYNKDEARPERKRVTDTDKEELWRQNIRTMQKAELDAPLDIFGSLFPRNGLDPMMQQRMAEEFAARQQAAYIQKLFGSLGGMGMPRRSFS